MKYLHKILPIILLLFVFFDLPAQQFKNLNFSQFCDTAATMLCNWNLTYGLKGSARQDHVDGLPCLLLQGSKENSVTWAEQSSEVDFSKGIRVLTVNAYIKTENAEGKGVGFNINLYDKEGNFIGFKDMGQRYSLDWVRGSQAWKRYTLSVVCPAETGRINIGAIFYGKGKAWFKEYDVSISNIANRKPTRLALEYVTAACDTIYRHSLWKDSINIQKLKKDALQIAGQAKQYKDCYTAVQYLIESLRPLGDNHSFFMKADEYKNWQTNGSLISKVSVPQYKLIDSCGYILVPGFHSGNKEAIKAFADSIQLAIKNLSIAGIRGWIIDLQQNDGGNQEPMIAGLGPLFSGEKLGSLIDLYGNAYSWYYKKGKYWGDGEDGWNVTNPTTLNVKLPIAVLTSSKTGSSGEIVAISFIGNDLTKSFGSSTGGYTTGTMDYELKDGSRIFLASTVMADRNAKKYKGSISPDIPISSSSQDDVINAAIKWVKSFY